MSAHPVPCYDVVALQMTIYYNREGDHDQNGMLFTLKENARTHWSAL